MKSKQPSLPLTSSSRPPDPSSPGWFSRYWDTLFLDRPPFKQTLRETWFDTVWIPGITILAGAGYFFLTPIGTRYFLLTDPQYAYPLMDEYIPTWMSAIISCIGPGLFMVPLILIFTRSHRDLTASLTGLSYALALSTFFQFFIKLLFGGLRPNFLSVCLPSPVPGAGAGPTHAYYTRTVCLGDAKAINDAMMSFPSGHSSAAFAGFLFLSLWLNAKFKIFGRQAGGGSLVLLFIVPILVAALIAGSKVLDRWHHWRDVLAGSVLGSFFAFVGYRAQFRSVWDERTNHVPRRAYEDIGEEVPPEAVDGTMFPQYVIYPKGLH